MAYIVQSSERVRGIGTEYETKAMLYLMNCREDSYQINFFAIDFYNDVTGLNALADKAWDVQSKGTKTGGPKEVGKELVTLFKNFMSELNFDYLILFLATVPATLRKDNSLTTFGIENITEGRPLKALREGLVEEAGKKEYISDEWITDANIDAFLNRVTFVVDDKSKAEYVRGIMSVNPKYIPQDNVLDGIFNKIRDAQSAKKNNESVEGEMVTHLREVLYFDRVLKVREIRLAVVLGHKYPVMMDYFRDGELSTEKENVVLRKFGELSNQIIFTATLKAEELGKYATNTSVNAIDYSTNTASHILNTNHVAEFKNLLKPLMIKL